MVVLHLLSFRTVMKLKERAVDRIKQLISTIRQMSRSYIYISLAAYPTMSAGEEYCKIADHINKQISKEFIETNQVETGREWFANDHLKNAFYQKMVES